MSFVPTSTTVIDPWTRILGALEKKVNRQSFNTFLKPTRMSHLERPDPLRAHSFR